MVEAIGGDIVKNVMTYKGYTARIEFDRRDTIFTGKILGIKEEWSGVSAARITRSNAG